MGYGEENSDCVVKSEGEKTHVDNNWENFP